METQPHPWTPFVKAVLAYDAGDLEARVVVYDDLGDRDEWDLAHFFRDKTDMPNVERRALELCRGDVLDIGAGAGCHSLELQARGFRVTAMEPDPVMTELLSRRGVESVIQGDLNAQGLARFDTVLLMMNGVGLCGTEEGLVPLLRGLHDLVKPGGQVLTDSTDMRSAFEAEFAEEDRYIGEVTFQFEFQGERAPPFPFLYVDPDLMQSAARETGWKAEVLLVEGPAFLTRLTEV
jgi:SAM-dependent methyltransferase